jgi:hypothetical protein
MLWVAIHPFRYDSGVGAVTTAVEIEFEGERLGQPDIINKVGGLAAYLIERGMIDDGDSETERLKARPSASRADRCCWSHQRADAEARTMRLMGESWERVKDLELADVDVSRQR